MSFRFRLVATLNREDESAGSRGVPGLAVIPMGKGPAFSGAQTTWSVKGTE